MAKLKAKPGIKGVGVGGKEYTVDKKGFVTVPDEFVPAVLDAGFVVPEGEPQAAASTPNDETSDGAGNDSTGSGTGSDSTGTGSESTSTATE